ncbi:UDP-N-acetylmuramoyl-L-alanyl-D-glutamate--2,6-diaminopimelate ligase [Candidatus Dependentiae bacterium]|nr:UDP-N-acetylmuramoyl-L-alanyl-D-glutamate--2,6-diaminopimelate ligase [Candidatus Dependentiae bacterium]
MKISELIKNIDFIKKNYVNEDITGITDNTAEVKQKFLFVAKKGEKIDSHNFICQAIKLGAKAVIHSYELEKYYDNIIYLRVPDKENITDTIIKLCQNFYGNPGKKLTIIGITGTNGKTTIATLLKYIINNSGKKCLQIGTINANIGKKIFKINNTTPGPFVLYKLFKEAVDRKAEYAVMEISSHSIKQNRLDLSEIDCAVYTNLTQDHLDYHKTMQDYINAKSMLFKYMKKNGTAIVNNDDKYFKNIIDNCFGKKIITYSINNKSDITGIPIECSLTANKFHIKYKNKVIEIKSKLIGHHNIYNILAVFGLSKFLRIEENVFVKLINKFCNVPGRLDKVKGKNGIHIFIDYAHTPDALENVLNALTKLKSGNKLITVFGCGGDRDRLKRPLMGKIAVDKSDYAIITSDNPRSEKPTDIINEIKTGCKGYNNYCVIENRTEAIKKAIISASKNDIVLIAGKGHENYQIIGNKTIEFDDKKVAMKFIKTKKSFKN